MKRQKRAAAIHDISCFGKCSLTVALPILSAAGIETAVIPTAVLSTHTGGFSDFTYRDLTADMRPIMQHWKSLGLSFDAVYSGYLGSFEQVGIVEEFLSMFRSEDTLVLVDPAMADGGQLYKTFSPPFVQEMKGLCMHADLLVPNITEAAMLTGETYREGPYDHAYIETLLRGLLSLGARQAVLTGVWFDQRQYGAASLALGERAPHYVFSPRVDGFYHGTGDVFASALLAARLNGRPLEEAARIAVDLTCGSILRTRAAGTDLRFGVNFEEGLPAFIRALGL
ncbi:MAG TPA: pyridoxamine kinase [Candidatus Fimivicinus intestinavium]|nr:pyridoxamine kinase [Candidatus Fimivicinus intestinavium]